MTENNPENLSEKIGANLPYLRRYARALTGSQERGDQYAMATLEAVLSDHGVFDTSISPKTALFKVFQPIWASSGAVFSDDETGLQAKAQAHLSKLTTNTREALLLHTIEEFSFSDVGLIMDVSEDEARSLVEIAYDEMSSVLSGRVMIIEDEAIIAMDLEGIVSDMGHRVTGIARTESDALKLFNDETPDLIARRHPISNAIATRPDQPLHAQATGSSLASAEYPHVEQSRRCVHWATSRVVWRAEPTAPPGQYLWIAPSFPTGIPCPRC